MHLVQRVLLRSSWWDRPELNQCDADFQSAALPTELRSHIRVAYTLQIGGLEPTTYCLTDNCSTSWAKLATSCRFAEYVSMVAKVWTRTRNLRLMRPVSYHFSTPQYIMGSYKVIPRTIWKEMKIGLKPISGANGWNRPTDPCLMRAML